MLWGVGKGVFVLFFVRAASLFSRERERERGGEDLCYVVGELQKGKRFVLVLFPHPSGERKKGGEVEGIGP